MLLTGQFLLPDSSWYGRGSLYVKHINYWKSFAFELLFGRAAGKYFHTRMLRLLVAQLHSQINKTGKFLYINSKV